ncbi:uncharacterized protein LOC110819087 [Carica papaya]|uniref:uncharacterized protein LOC110819087 n=1 Tax=Carica papaya TaxID=3649 RepID=UPI000B8C97C1|nr:uncharacterized protein LOC110819087 [Carica papaya]
MAVVTTLKEVESATRAVFESLLSFMSGNRAQSKIKGWPLVSKLMQPKRIMSEESDSEVNEFEKVNAALHSLAGRRPISFERSERTSNGIGQQEERILSATRKAISILMMLLINQVLMG